MSGIIQPRSNVITAIKRLGLGTGLRFVLDMSDPVSNPNTGQKILDLSGNGYDFFRGIDNTATTDDPSFNGTPNWSDSAYLGLDGGDVARYDTTNETFMQNFHKDNAIFSFLVGWYAANAESGILGTSGINAGTEIGVDWELSPAGNFSDFVVRNNGVVNRFLANSGISGAVASRWNIFGFSCNEAVGANGACTMMNGETLLHTSTYTSPSAASATRTLELFSRGNALTKAASGSRFGFMACWEGTGGARSAAEFRALFHALRGKYKI